MDLVADHEHRVVVGVVAHEQVVEGLGHAVRRAGEVLRVQPRRRDERRLAQRNHAGIRWNPIGLAESIDQRPEALDDPRRRHLEGRQELGALEALRREERDAVRIGCRIDLREQRSATKVARRRDRGVEEQRSDAPPSPVPHDPSRDEHRRCRLGAAKRENRQGSEDLRSRLRGGGDPQLAEMPEAIAALQKHAAGATLTALGGTKVDRFGGDAIVHDEFLAGDCTDLRSSDSAAS